SRALIVGSARPALIASFELVDDLGGGGFWDADAIPETRPLAPQEITPRPGGGQRGRARRGGYCERTQPGRPAIPARLGTRGEVDLRDTAGSAAAPAARCRNCRRGSFI